jgi:hypothetical protein
MKRLLIIVAFFTFCTFYASAQTSAAYTDSANWFANPVASATIADEVGNSVSVCDTVYDYRVVSPVLTLLNLGGKYPNQKLTVTLKGDQLKLNPALMKGKAVCFYGPVTLFKNKPEMVITGSTQIKDAQQYQ